MLRNVEQKEKRVLLRSRNFELSSNKLLRAWVRSLGRSETFGLTFTEKRGRPSSREAVPLRTLILLHSYLKLLW